MALKRKHGLIHANIAACAQDSGNNDGEVIDGEKEDPY